MEIVKPSVRKIIKQNMKAEGFKVACGFVDNRGDLLVVQYGNDRAWTLKALLLRMPLLNNVGVNWNFFETKEGA